MILCLALIPNIDNNIHLIEIDESDNGYLGYESHSPFYIQGNEMLLDYAATEGWPGTGTSDAPIIIEGYSFRNYTHVFTMSDTDLHFIFRNNILDGIDDRWCVIVFSNVRNAVVHDNTIINGAVGAHIMKTNDSVISNNHIYGQSWDAVYMETGCYRNIIENNYFHDMYEAGVWSWNYCSDNIIRGNTIHDVIYGVSFRDNTPRNCIVNNTIHNATFSGVYSSCNDTTISENIIFNIKGDGINIKSRLNIIEDNLVYDVGGFGIHLFDTSGDNQINRNTMIRNSKGGIRIRSSDNNIIQNNNLFENGIPQIYDSGTENIYQENYWHELQGEDAESDGYYDSAYIIPGIAGSIDIFPRTAPNEPVPDWYDYENISFPIIDESTSVTSMSETSTITITTSTSTTSSIPTSTETSESTVTTTTKPNLTIPLIIVTLGITVIIGMILIIKFKRV